MKLLRFRGGSQLSEHIVRNPIQAVSSSEKRKTIFGQLHLVCEDSKFLCKIAARHGFFNHRIAPVGQSPLRFFSILLLVPGAKIGSWAN